MLKAAQAAAAEPGSDAGKAIHQRHLEERVREVLAGKNVMRQSLLELNPTTTAAERVRPSPVVVLTPTLVTTVSVLALLLAVVALVLALLR